MGIQGAFKHTLKHTSTLLVYITIFYSILYYYLSWSAVLRYRCWHVWRVNESANELLQHRAWNKRGQGSMTPWNTLLDFGGHFDPRKVLVISCPNMCVAVLHVIPSYKSARRSLKTKSATVKIVPEVYIYRFAILFPCTPVPIADLVFVEIH